MTGPALPPAAGVAHSNWSRLHPLSPLVRFGRAAGALLFILVSNLSTGLAGGARGHGGGGWWLTLFLALAGLLGGFVSWWVTTWRLDRRDLQIKSGLVRRQSLRLPLARIQAVDVISPLLGRLFGLAEVRVVVAGRGSERGRLGYLPVAEARALRAQLLALAHGLAADTPEPAATPVVVVSNPRLVATALLSPAGLAASGLVVAGGVVSAVIPHGSLALGGLLPPMVGLLMESARRLNADLNFVITEAPDGLRLRRGAIQLRSETIPAGRIQAVRWVEPLLWRPLGWCRLEVDVARQAASHRSDEGSRQFSRQLLPVGTRAEAAWLLSRALPGSGPGMGAGSSPPRRALLRAPLSYHYLRLWVGERHLAARTGRLRPATVIIPLEKVQSLRLRSGPWQRRLRLASLHVDTAGRRWQAAAECRDEGEAAVLLDRLSDRARSARRAAGRPPGPLRTARPRPAAAEPGPDHGDGAA